MSETGWMRCDDGMDCCIVGAELLLFDVLLFCPDRPTDRWFLRSPELQGELLYSLYILLMSVSTFPSGDDLTLEKETGTGTVTENSLAILPLLLHLQQQ